MRAHVRTIGIVLFASALLIPTILGRTDSQTGRIRLLYVGQWPYIGRPQYLLEDPLLDTSVVPYYDFSAQLTEITRYMRLRYPRTRKFLTDNFDMVAFTNIELLAFTTAQIQILPESVRQDGLGFMMSGGHTSFGGTTGSYPGWMGTSVDEILPVEVINGMYLKPFTFRLVVSDPANALMSSLPWSGVGIFTYSLNAVTMRQDGTLLAEADLDEGWPILVYGDYGEGRTLAYMTPLISLKSCNYNLQEWGFYDDMCANMAYFTTGVELPKDPFVVHQLRTSYRSYSDQRLLFLSMLEFIDRFGASTAKLEEELAGIEVLRAQSYTAYISQEFEHASDLMSQVLEQMKAGRNRAVEVKDAAMLWVYVIEWLVVTATLMVAGSVLWTLMMRRRLYKEIRSTRLIGGSG